MESNFAFDILVSSRVMHKYETESRKVGKGSFAYAWVLDETNEERERGITMDVGHSGNREFKIGMIK